MPKRLAIVASAIALVLAPAALVACGGDDNSEFQHEPQPARPPGPSSSRRATTLTLWTMPNSPKPKEDLREDGRAVHGQDRREGRRAGGRLGRPVRPHPQRRGLRRGPGHHAGRHDPGAVLRRARRLHRPERPRRRHRRQAAPTPTGIWNTTQVEGQDGTWAIPWFTEARSIYYRKDVLEKAGVDPATAFKDLDVVQGHAAGDQGQGPGHRAVRRARQEGVRPRPQRDAVRVGQRRRRALRRRQEVDDQLARGPAGRRVHGRPDHRRAVRQEPARARRHAGREPVQGRQARGLDRRPVGARLDRPRRGRHVERRGAQERRRRPDADRPRRQGVHVRGRLGPDDASSPPSTRTRPGR